LIWIKYTLRRLGPNAVTHIMALPDDVSTLYDQCAALLAQGRTVSVDQMTRLLGVQEAAFLRLSELAYPLSHPATGIQLVFRDLLMVLQRDTRDGDLGSAVERLASAAAQPRLISAVRTDARAAATSASACFCADCALT
jgi:hypothetical protein